jgi:hypothetical protein
MDMGEPDALSGMLGQLLVIFSVMDRSNYA